MAYGNVNWLEALGGIPSTQDMLTNTVLGALGGQQSQFAAPQLQIGGGMPPAGMSAPPAEMQGAPAPQGMMGQMGQNFQQAGGLDAVLGSPAIMAGLGLLGSARSNNPWSGAMQGLLGSQMYKRQQQEYDLKMKEYKFEQMNRDEIRKAAQAALKTIDYDEDGRISPMEQQRADLLRAAAATGDPKLIEQANAKLPSLGPQSTIAKLAADLQAGRITQDQYDAALPRTSADNLIAKAEALGIDIASLTPDQRIKLMGGGTTVNVNADVPSGYMRDPNDPSRLIPQPGGPNDPTNPLRVEAGDKTARFAADNMLNAAKSAEEVLNTSGFDPTTSRNLLANIPVLGNFAATPEFQQYRATADEWTTNMVFLRSGATARQEEKDSAFRNFWPQPGDSKETVLSKAAQRAKAELEAYQRGFAASGVATPEDEQKIAGLSSRAQAADAIYRRFISSKGGNAPRSSWTPEDQARLEELERKRGG